MEGFNTYEYGAEQKSEGKWKTLRVLMVLGYAFLVLAYFVLLYIIRLIPLFAITPIWLWILCHFTWKYTKPDYRYFIEKGSLSFYVYYGKKSKKEKTRFAVSSAQAIAPKDTLLDKIRKFSPAHVYSAVPSLKSTDVYCALYTDKNGEKCALYFVATQSALKLLRFYNSKTVVSDTVV